MITLGATDVRAAQAFYEAVFTPTATSRRDGERVELNLHDAARLTLCPAGTLAGAGPTAPGYRGYVLTYIVGRPAEVRNLLDAAVRHGAVVRKPAKKALFAGFSAVFQAPDGAVWKLASAEKKDTGAAAATPVPSEVGVLLGVAATKASAAFHQAVGLTVDRDYGSKYIDFQPAATGSRLGLMERGTLAKDAGVEEGGGGFRAVAFERTVASPASLLAAAERAGGRVVDADGGQFIDPDGFLWRVRAV